MTFLTGLARTPRTTHDLVYLDPALLEQFPASEPEPDALAARPLPLGQVLTNIDALHGRCNGTHVCGLPRHLQTYDLVNYLKVLRASRVGG
jgi:hypothetical protein